MTTADGRRVGAARRHTASAAVEDRPSPTVLRARRRTVTALVALMTVALVVVVLAPRLTHLDRTTGLVVAGLVLVAVVLVAAVLVIGFDLDRSDRRPPAGNERAAGSRG